MVACSAPGILAGLAAIPRSMPVFPPPFGNTRSRGMLGCQVVEGEVFEMKERNPDSSRILKTAAFQLGQYRIEEWLDFLDQFVRVAIFQSANAPDGEVDEREQGVLVIR